ncbi:MAG: prepilin-type N-terminal cleavage/methylation domain-containing protein [Sulfurimonas sp.]|nr:prepilin-type N-terminal cleavage/methylation domain-containing protein [Sulfurimonas sp.]
MKKFKYAFTMIELVFVIVVLGILAAVAIPKLAVTRNDATLAKGKADIATIRSAIVTERQSQLIKGVNTWIPKLSNGTGALFTGSDANRTLLMYGIAAGEWAKTNDTTYTFTTGGVTTTFTYSNATGTFTCTAGSYDCDKLTK